MHEEPTRKHHVEKRGQDCHDNEAPKKRNMSCSMFATLDLAGIITCFKRFEISQCRGDMSSLHVAISLVLHGYRHRPPIG